LFAVRRADIESFARDLEAIGRAWATVTRRLSAIAGFYKCGFRRNSWTALRRFMSGGRGLLQREREIVLYSSAGEGAHPRHMQNCPFGETLFCLSGLTWHRECDLERYAILSISSTA
jgi:hypothetical protein